MFKKETMILRLQTNDVYNDYGKPIFDEEIELKGVLTNVVGEIKLKTGGFFNINNTDIDTVFQVNDFDLDFSKVMQLEKDNIIYEIIKKEKQDSIIGMKKVLIFYLKKIEDSNFE